MARRYITPKATRVPRDAEIDSLSTEWCIQWPSNMQRWGKTYIAIERHNPGTIELLTAARRQPVKLVQRNRIIDAVKAAIYAAKSEEAKELKKELPCERLAWHTFKGAPK